MRGIERIDLISRIGRELQERMTFSDIDVYLHGFKINTNIPNISTNSKWVYAKKILGNEGDDIIFKIADELEIDHNFKSISTNPQIECEFWVEGYLDYFSLIFQSSNPQLLFFKKHFYLMESLHL